MNYYQHHIGDFNNDTRHLTRVERSLYRDLIELYYDKESPLTCDVKTLSRLMMARTTDEKKALTAVLDEYFTLSGDLYHNSRCDIEIAKYRANNSAKARAGKASAAAKKKVKEALINACSTGVKQPTEQAATDVQQTKNHKPVTKNRKPRTKNQEPKKETSIAISFDVLELSRPEIEEVKRIRKQNKGGVLSQRAVNGLGKQFALSRKRGFTNDDILTKWDVRGWKSFEDEWMGKPANPIREKSARNWDAITGGANNEQSVIDGEFRHE